MQWPVLWPREGRQGSGCRQLSCLIGSRLLVAVLAAGGREGSSEQNKGGRQIRESAQSVETGPQGGLVVPPHVLYCGTSARCRLQQLHQRPAVTAGQ